MTLICGTLVACGDSAPNVFEASDVPPEVLNAPHAVHGTSSASETTSASWPRLGDVPSKPKDFHPDRSVWTVDDMVEDRATGNAIRTQIENAPDDYAQVPPTADAVIPAAPVLNPSTQP